MDQQKSVEPIKGLWHKEANKEKLLFAYRTTPFENNCQPDELFLRGKLKMNCSFNTKEKTTCKNSGGERNRCSKDKKKTTTKVELQGH